MEVTRAMTNDEKTRDASGVASSALFGVTQMGAESELTNMG
jgi:hypothetical protein